MEQLSIAGSLIDFCEKERRKSIALKGQKEEPKYVQDEGWAWVVLVASTLTMFTATLPLMGFGLLYSPVLESFDVQPSTIGWINSVHSFIFNCACMFTGPLCDAFSWRAIGAAAAIINASSVLLSTWIPRPSVLYLYVSILEALGGSLLVSISFFVVPYYFKKRRGFAISVNSLGTCASMMIGPPVIVGLINNYGTKGTFALIGAFLLNGISFTSLFHPLEWHPINCGNRIIKSHNNSPNQQSLLIKNEPKLDSKIHLFSKLLDVMKDTFSSFHLLKQRKILHIFFSKTFIYLGVLNFQMWIAFALLDRGISLDEASYCLSASGIGNLLGRITIAILADCHFINVLTFFKGSLLLMALSILAFAHVSSLTLSGLCIAVWGWSVGTVMPLFHLCIIKVVGLKLFPRMLGLASFCAGTFLPLIGPIIGYLKDNSNTFALPLTFLSGLVGIAFILWVTMPTDTENTAEEHQNSF